MGHLRTVPALFGRGHGWHGCDPPQRRAPPRAFAYEPVLGWRAKLVAMEKIGEVCREA